MSDDEKQYNLAQTIDDKDIFKMALDTRNFEISMFWQRSNYFLVLNTALGVGFFKVEDPYSLGIAFFAFLVSLVWFRVCLGSKFWQSRWEQRLAKVEKKVAPDLQFFAADWSLVYADVQSSVAGSGHKGWLRVWLDKQTMKKHSVSYNMTLLSLAFCVAWALGASVQGWLLQAR